MADHVASEYIYHLQHNTFESAPWHRAEPLDQERSERRRFRLGLGRRARSLSDIYAAPASSPPEAEQIEEQVAQLPLRSTSPDPRDRAQPPLRRVRSMANTNTNSFPSLDTSFNNRSPSPAAGSQVNGNGMNNGVNYLQPLPAGHQQDLNFLYAQIQELSAILQSNRDKVNDITRNAEEVARRANQSNGTSSGAGDHDADKARIRELEHELAKSNKIIDLYKHEQKENTALIAQYEDALGTATEQIRNYCNDIDSRFLGQRRHYNNLLQAEKDEHLASRLDRDHWHAETLRLCGMIRTAYRLRCDEWNDEFRVVRGLQEEVRCLRRCIGLEDEKPEEETGWPYLKDDPYAPHNQVQQQQQGQAQPQNQG